MSQDSLRLIQPRLIGKISAGPYRENLFPQKTAAKKFFSGPRTNFRIFWNYLPATLSIIERPPKNVSTKDLVITVEGQAVSKNVVDLEGVEIKSDASPIEVRITTQVQLRPEARYTDDEYQPLGTGPVPPEAGITTTYQIQWYLSN